MIADNEDTQVVCIHVNQMNSHGNDVNCIEDELKHSQTEQCETRLANP